MIPTYVQQLNKINREFYTAFAAAFAESRSLAQPSLLRLVALVPAAGRVLDVGCGHGRLAHLLDQHRPGATYQGLDFSVEFVRQGREQAAGLAHTSATYHLTDLTRLNWASLLAGRQYDTVFVLAVLHHIPGYDNRLAVLRTLSQYLAPDGRMAISAWQFTANERMRRKIVSWDQVGLDPAGLEPGDYLLNWKRGGLGYRYCHLIDQEEMVRMAAESGLDLLEAYRADGKEGDLSLFGVLAQPDK